MRTKAGICRIFGLLAIWALLIAAPVAAADDAHTCASLSGDAGIAFCSKLIASGRFKGLDLAWLYNNRGAVQLNDKRDYDRAIADFTQALSVQKFVAGFANRGFAYYKKGDYDSAIADYTLVIRSLPNAAQTFLRRGDAYFSKNDNDRAISDYAEASRLDPLNVDGFFGLGNALRAQARYPECTDAYGRGIKTIAQPGKDDFNIFYYRGICNDLSKNWAAAEADLKRALELFPDEPNVLNYLGYSWVSRGVNFDQGVAMIKRALEQRPNDGSIVDSLGWAFYLTGQYDSALIQLKRAVSLLPDDPDIADHLGDILSKLGQTGEAKAQWTRAIALKPTPDNRKLIEAKLQSGTPGAPVTITQASAPDAPVVTVNSGHSKIVQWVRFSPDGRWYASASEDATIKLWDTASGQLIRTLTGHTKQVNAIAITSDGRWLVSTSEDESIKIWDVNTGKVRQTIAADSDFQPVIVSSDGQSITAGTFLSEGIQRWDFASGDVKQKLPRQEDTDSLYSLALSQDGKLLAAGLNLKNKTFSIRLMDSASFATRLTIERAHTDWIKSLALSPDGRTIASASWDKTIKFWDVTSGKLLRTLSRTERVHSISYSPDGRFLVSAGQEGVHLWNAATGQLERAFAQGGAPATAVDYSRDGRFIVSGHDNGELNVWEAESGRLLQSQNGQPDSPATVAAISNAQWLIAGSREMTVWDSYTGQVASAYPRDPDSYPDAAFVARDQQITPPDGKGQMLVAAKSKKTTITISEAATGKEIRTFDWGPTTAKYPDIRAFAVSADGRFLAASSSDKGAVIRLWDIKSGKMLHSLPGHSKDSSTRTLAFSSDGNRLASSAYTFGVGSGTKGAIASIRIWDVATGTILRTFDQENAPSDVLAFSPSGQQLLADAYGHSSRYDVQLLDTGTGQASRTISELETRRPEQAVFSPDGTNVALFWTTGSEMLIAQTAAGGRIATLTANSGVPRSVSFSPDNRHMIVANQNRTTTVWSTETTALLTTTIQSPAGEWLTITPEGFFVASNKGAELLHIVQGFNITGIDQVYQSLYRPDLVREKLAGDPRGLVRDAAAKLDLTKTLASGSAPDVQLTLPGRSLGQGSVDGTNVSAAAEITDRGGGIGRVEWRVNGVATGIETPPPGSAGQPVRLTRTLALDPGDNTIEVVAYNGANLVASVPARASVAARDGSPPIVPSQPGAPSTTPAPAAVVAAKPRLFLLVAGVNEYADQRFRLSYAVSDAKEVARGFREAAGNLYQSVEVKLLTDAEVTKDKLDIAFSEMARKISTSDVFVLYLAGHGKTLDGRYYFVPQDFAVEGKLSDEAINAAVNAKAIAQDQWQRWFASIPARKSVILFDTCDSGTLTGDAAETQQLEKGAANERLAQATGRSILTASGGSQEALEGYRGHGLFTYEVLDAINQADGDRSGTVEVNELAAYVYAQVSELSQNVFKQRQVPQMKITANYPLIRQTRILRDEVTPVAEAKPTYQLAQAAQLQIKPNPGATVVRSLSAKTPVTVLESKDGWSLIASEGKPLGYVATRDLARVE